VQNEIIEEAPIKEQNEIKITEKNVQNTKMNIKPILDFRSIKANKVKVKHWLVKKL
jgi:hypothetical protein